MFHTHCKAWTCCSLGTEHLRPHHALAAPASLTQCISPLRLVFARVASTPLFTASIAPIHSHPVPLKSPFVSPQECYYRGHALQAVKSPVGLSLGTIYRQSCTLLLGNILSLFRTFFLSLFRLELPPSHFWFPFLLSHRTRDVAAPSTRS